MAQVSHAVFDLGRQIDEKDRDESNYLIVCQAKSERELLREHKKLVWSYKDALGDPFVNEICLFREPDLDNEATALAVYIGMPEEHRRLTNRWKLWVPAHT